MKIKSFGIVEALIASMVIVLILTGAVAVSSSMIKNSSLDASYQEAESLAEEVFSLIEAGRATGELTFVGGTSGSGIYPIQCFDSEFINNSTSNAPCFESGSTYQTLLPYYTFGGGNDYSSSQFNGAYFPVTRVRNPNFPSGYFEIKIQVPDDPGSYECVKVAGFEAPSERCPLVDIEVQWEEGGKVQKYYALQRFTDWQR